MAANLCPTPQKERRLIALFALAVLLLGIGQILILPPFEGFDEIAHYSSIRQIADTGTIPILGESYIAQEVIDYRKNGPMPYSVYEPYDQNNGLTYPAFFADKDKIAQYEQIYRTPTSPPPFTPSTDYNWQAQHPPLYYILMTPIEKAVAGLSFVSQFLVLRIISFLLAFAGLIIAQNATLKYYNPSSRNAIILAFFIYPIIVPQFFPEFGRLGNDSLCLFFMGLTWHFLLRWLQDEFHTPLALALGLTLALGLFTKAFFIPITAGLGIFLLIRLWHGRSDRVKTKERLDFLFVPLLPILLAGFWYLYTLKAYGSAIGSHEIAALNHETQWEEIFTKNFSVYETSLRFLAIVYSWLWAGTASLARHSAFYHIPLVAVNLWLIVSYFKSLRKNNSASLHTLPAWIIGLFVCGFAYHTFTVIVLPHSGATPGWYLSVILPLFAIAYSGKMQQALKNRTQHFAIMAFALYSVFFLVLNVSSNIALYGGCASVDSAKLYQFPNTLHCLDKIDIIFQNLAHIAYPIAGILCITTGLACYGLAFFKLRSHE